MFCISLQGLVKPWLQLGEVLGFSMEPQFNGATFINIFLAVGLSSACSISSCDGYTFLY